MTVPTNKKSDALSNASRRKVTHKATLALVNAIMLAGAAHAETNTVAPSVAPNSAAGTNAPAKLPDVVVKGQRDESYKTEAVSSRKYTEPLVDVPQTITIVPHAVMEQQGATTLRDVLKNVPGISIQAGEGGVPTGDNLSIRGFNARTDLFIDGIRDFAGYSRDPFNFEQVEVVKGPASTYAGRGSTGGSVNMVSKTPGLQPFYNGSIGFGSDAYQRLTLDVNQPIKNEVVDGMAFRFNALQYHSDTPGRDVVSNDRWGIAPSLTFGLGTPTRVTLSYFHLSQDNIPDYGLPWVPTNNIPLAPYRNQAPPADFSNFYGLKARDYERIDTDILTGEIKHDFNEAISLRDVTRFGRTSRDSIVTAPRFLNAATTLITRTDWKSRDQINDLAANQLDLTTHLDSGKIDQTVVSGIDFARETETGFIRAKKGLNSPPTSLFDPNPDDPYLERISRTGARNEVASTSVGLYTFDTIKLGEKFELNGGLRWDQFSTDFDAIASNGSFTNGTPLSRTDRMLSWRAGAVFKPTSKGSVYVAFGTSFNPSAEGLSLSTNLNSAANFTVDPEESRSYELGTKWEFFDRKLLVNAALFRTEKTNARTEDPANPLDVVVLDGEERVDGIELGAAGSVTKDWKVFGGYTFMSSEIVKSKNPLLVGRELSNTPEHTFNMWTTYELPWKLTLGAGAQFTDERLNTSVPARVAPSYWLFDGMATYNVNKNLSVQLNVYNLTDEKYIDRLGGGHFVPGNGRSAVIAANLRF